VRRKGESEQEDQKIRRVLVLIFATFAFALALTGCQTHACDSSSVTGPPGTVTQSKEGWLVWQSAPADGPWLDFPGNATVHFTYPAGFSNPFTWDAFVSTDPYQEAGAGTFTQGGGQPAEFTSLAPGSIDVTNSSCAEYYLRVVAYEFPPESDAGADARTDAPVDAGRD
jgi:hypothetical protein